MVLIERVRLIEFQLTETKTEINLNIDRIGSVYITGGGSYDRKNFGQY